MNKLIQGRGLGRDQTEPTGLAAALGEIQASFSAAVASRQAVANIRPTSMDDWFALDAMKDAIRRHLLAALLECSAIARDFVALDADQLMTDLRAEFDPEFSNALIQDAFREAFFAHYGALKDLGVEPLVRAKTLPSGASVQE